MVDNTFNAGHKIDPVRIETREHTFLYNDDEGYHFMNTESHELIAEKHLISAPQFLKDGLSCLIVFHAEEERPIGYVQIRGIGNHLHGAGCQGGHSDQLPEACHRGHRCGSRGALVHRHRNWIKVDTRTGDYRGESKWRQRPRP